MPQENGTQTIIVAVIHTKVFGTPVVNNTEVFAVTHK